MYYGNNVVTFFRKVETGPLGRIWDQSKEGPYDLAKKTIFDT